MCLPFVKLRALPLLIVCALMTACSSSPSEARGQVLVAWHSLTGVKEQAFLELVDQWNRTNSSGITVVPERRTLAAFHAGVLEGIAQNALPALLLASPMQASVYDQKGALLPLDSFIDDASDEVGWGANDRADLYPFVLQAGQAPNGTIKGIPFGGAARMVLYNTDWLKSLNFDSLPEDWDRLSAACAAATDRAKGTLCFGLDPSSVSLGEWLFAHGGRLITDDKAVLQVSTPAAQAAVSRMIEFVRAGQAYRATTRAQSRDDLASGRVLFLFDWSDQLGDVAAAIKSRAGFDWGIGLLPAENGTPATMYRGSLWVIPQLPANRNPGREKAAWLFIRWLLDEPQTVQWATRTGELPARASAINMLTTDQQSYDQALAGVLQNIAPVAHPYPMVSGWGCVENVLSDGLRQILDGKSVTETLQIVQATGQSELSFDCSLQ